MFLILKHIINLPDYPRCLLNGSGHYGLDPKKESREIQKVERLSWSAIFRFGIARPRRALNRVALTGSPTSWTRIEEHGFLVHPVLFVCAKCMGAFGCSPVIPLGSHIACLP